MCMQSWSRTGGQPGSQETQPTSWTGTLLESSRSRPAACQTLSSLCLSGTMPLKPQAVLEAAEEEAHVLQRAPEVLKLFKRWKHIFFVCNTKKL